MLVTGTVYPELEKVYAKYPARSPRIVFRNQRDGSFVELGEEAGAAISARHSSRGSGGSPLLPLVLVALIIAALAIGAVVLWRRRPAEE